MSKETWALVAGRRLSIAPSVIRRGWRERNGVVIGDLLASAAQRTYPKSLSDGGGAVLLIDDVVAVEHCARLPPAELHDRALVHSGPAEVSRGGAPQVVDARS